MCDLSYITFLYSIALTTAVNVSRRRNSNYVHAFIMLRINVELREIDC